MLALLKVAVAHEQIRLQRSLVADSHGARQPSTLLDGAQGGKRHRYRRAYHEGADVEEYVGTEGDRNAGRVTIAAGSQEGDKNIGRGIDPPYPQGLAEIFIMLPETHR